MKEKYYRILDDNITANEYCACLNKIKIIIVVLLLRFSIYRWKCLSAGFLIKFEHHRHLFIERNKRGVN